MEWWQDGWITPEEEEAIKRQRQQELMDQWKRSMFGAASSPSSGKDPLETALNLYRQGERDTTPYQAPQQKPPDAIDEWARLAGEVKRAGERNTSPFSSNQPQIDPWQSAIDAWQSGPPKQQAPTVYGPEPKPESNPWQSAVEAWQGGPPPQPAYDPLPSAYQPKQPDQWQATVDSWQSGPPVQQNQDYSFSFPMVGGGSRLEQDQLPPIIYDVQQPPKQELGYDRPDLGAPSIQYAGPQSDTAQIEQPPFRYDPLSSAYPNQRPAGDTPVGMVDLQPQANLAWDAARYGWSELTGGEYTPTNPMTPVLAGLIGYGVQGVKESAPYERMQYETENRDRSTTTLGDVGQAIGGAWDAMGQNRDLILNELGQTVRGDQPISQGFQDYWQNVQLAPAYKPATTALYTTKPGQVVADTALDVASGLQAIQDATNTIELPNKATVGENMAAGLTAAYETAKQNLAPEEGPADYAPRLKRAQDLIGGFIQSFQQQIEQYQQAVTPTTEQAAGMTPLELEKNKQRARLNWADPTAVANTFDALVDQNKSAADLEAEAKKLYEAGANSSDEELRKELWVAAAEKGAKAYQIKNAHPIEIVNQNTDLAKQLIFELIQPDLTDIIGGYISLANAGVRGRRLTKVGEEVLQPADKVALDLAKMAVGPETKAAMLAEKSGYNKVINLWTTGQARANLASDKLHRFMSILMTDTDTISDARILLNQLATDPSKLITGMPANLFQSEGLVSRAGEDGLVRFGSMNLNNIKEPLRIYQQAAQEFLQTAESLKNGPLLNKVDFAADFRDAVQQAGYRFYNVANELGEAPLGTTTTRLKAVEGNQYIIEYMGADKKLIGQSEPMLLQEASQTQRSLIKQIGKGQLAQQSALAVIGQAMRKTVSPFYIYLSPGTWATNIIGGVSTALGDGTLAGGLVKNMDTHLNKLFGIDPTLRGFEGAENLMGVAGQTGVGGFLAPLKKAYGAIEENMGKRVYYNAVTHALKKTGKDIIFNTVAPILKANGIEDLKQIRKVTDHLFEVGYSGGNLVDEFNKLLNGQTRVFSLSNVNQHWLDALAPDSLEEFYSILRTAPDRETALAQLNDWVANANRHWDRIIQEAPPVPQQHVWSKQEVAQDMADLTQSGKLAQKYGGIDSQTVEAWKKTTAAAMQEAQRKMETLLMVVAESANPKNRYVLYNIWGSITDMTANVRATLSDLAEKASMAPQAQRGQAWRDYFAQAQQLWAERNARVNDLLEKSSAAIAKGEDFTPNVRQWDILERTAKQNEQKLWDTLRLEPGAGAYDNRLTQVIDAGRAISDKAVARVYAAARRFSSVDAMDHIISAERNVQLAGAQARAYLDLVLEDSIKSGKWQDYFDIRNETWRQLRQYEKDVWGIAERNIVKEGLMGEASTGLKFTDELEGSVELLGPETVTTQAANRMGPQRTTGTKEYTYWNVRKEDGTIVQLPDSNVPDEIKKRYRVLTPGQVEDEINLELDNIASAHPYAEDAQAILNEKAGVSGQVQKGLNLGNSENVEDLNKVADLTIGNTTKAGGVQAPQIGLAAMHAKEQLANIYAYVMNNIDDILKPTGALSEGQALHALDEFRRKVLPAWDNAKYMAAEFGNRMRSFTMVDFANNTRLDELAGLVMPYSFWFTRSIKNSAERMLFEPHVWRRVMQSERDINAMQEQRGDPKRYQGSIPIDLGNGMVYYLRVLPSKYWPTFGLFTSNDYADPESANNAFSYAMESMQATNAAIYPWLDAANKLIKGKGDDIYPISYIPQGKLIGWTAAALFGHEIPWLVRPGYYEYNVARELTTIVTEGQITKEEAGFAQDMMRQMRTGEGPLPEQASMQDRLNGILGIATRRAAQKELIAAGSSLLTGMGIRPFDTDEKRAMKAQQQYATRGYDPTTNPYGSKLAQNATFEQYPELGPKFSQGAVYDETKTRPGISAAKSAVYEKTTEARNQLYGAGNDAVEGLAKTNPDATKAEIYQTRYNAILAEANATMGKDEVDKFLTQFKAENGRDASYTDVVNFVTSSIEAKYPSAELPVAQRKEPKSPVGAKNPIEIQEGFEEKIFRTASELYPYPEWPGDNASPAEKRAYIQARGNVDKQRETWVTSALSSGGFVETGGMMEADIIHPRKIIPANTAMEKYEQWQDRNKTEFEKKRLAQIEQENAAKEDQWQGKRSTITTEFGEDAGKLWESYYSLPKGDARKEFLANNPQMRLYNVAAYNPEGYKKAKELFGQQALLDWAVTPDYADTDEAKAARAKWYDDHPNAFLVNSWLRGRPGQENEDAANQFNWGDDYNQAKKLFGDNIWDVVVGYKRSWDKKTKSAYYNANPQLTKFFDWWYGNLPKKALTTTSTGTGRSASSGGGGGAYSKLKGGSGRISVNIQPVYAQEMNRGLANVPVTSRGYQPSSIDLRWMQAGRDLKPGKSKDWEPSWIRGLRITK